MGSSVLEVVPAFAVAAAIADSAIAATGSGHHIAVIPVIDQRWRRACGRCEGRGRATPVRVDQGQSKLVGLAGHEKERTRGPVVEAEW